METPDATQIRAWSKIDFEGLGFGEDADLQVLVDRAAAQITTITGREWDSMPSEFEVTAAQVLQGITEQAAYQAQEDIAETSADFALINNFSAGSYSESRRSLTELAKSGLLNPNPMLHGLLYGMLTDDKKDDWIALTTGVNAPAFETTEVDWNFYGGRYEDPYGYSGAWTYDGFD